MSCCTAHRIYCDRCNFTSNTSRFWGSRKYLLADGREMWMAETWGWCFNCADLAAVEDLSCSESDWRRASRIREALREATLSACDCSRRVFTPLPEARLTALSQELEELECRLDFLSQRSATAKCLHCYSTAVAPVRSKWDGTENFCLEFVHPSCGGGLWVGTWRMRILDLWMPTFLFDPEGNFLCESRWEVAH